MGWLRAIFVVDFLQQHFLGKSGSALKTRDSETARRVCEAAAKKTCRGCVQASLDCHHRKDAAVNTAYSAAGRVIVEAGGGLARTACVKSTGGVAVGIIQRSFRRGGEFKLRTRPNRNHSRKRNGGWLCSTPHVRLAIDDAIVVCGAHGAGHPVHALPPGALSSTARDRSARCTFAAHLDQPVFEQLLRRAPTANEGLDTEVGASTWRTRRLIVYLKRDLIHPSVEASITEALRQQDPLQHVIFVDSRVDADVKKVLHWVERQARRIDRDQDAGAPAQVSEKAARRAKKGLSGAFRHTPTPEEA